jgi:hypothetical protein
MLIFCNAMGLCYCKINETKFMSSNLETYIFIDGSFAEPSIDHTISYPKSAADSDFRTARLQRERMAKLGKAVSSHIPGTLPPTRPVIIERAVAPNNVMQQVEPTEILMKRQRTVHIEPEFGIDTYRDEHGVIHPIIERIASPAIAVDPRALQLAIAISRIVISTDFDYQRSPRSGQFYPIDPADFEYEPQFTIEGNKVSGPYAVRKQL